MAVERSYTKHNILGAYRYEFGPSEVVAIHLPCTNIISVDKRKHGKRNCCFIKERIIWLIFGFPRMFHFMLTRRPKMVGTEWKVNGVRPVSTAYPPQSLITQKHHQYMRTWHPWRSAYYTHTRISLLWDVMRWDEMSWDEFEKYPDINLLVIYHFSQNWASVWRYSEYEWLNDSDQASKMLDIRITYIYINVLYIYNVYYTYNSTCCRIFLCGMYKSDDGWLAEFSMVALILALNTI